MKLLPSLKQKNQYVMNRLLQTYSLLLVGLISLTVVVLCVYTAQSNYKNMEQQRAIMQARVSSYMTDKDKIMSYIYMELASSTPNIDNVQKYLNLTPTDYFEFTQKYWEDYQRDTRVDSMVSGFFNAFQDLDEVTVKFDGYNKYLRVDAEHPDGVKISGPLVLEDGYLLKRPIVDQYTFVTIGQIYTVFSEDTVFGGLKSTMVEEGMDAYVIDNSDSVVFSTKNSVSNDQFVALKDSLRKNGTIPDAFYNNYYVDKKQTSKDFTYLIVANKNVLRNKNLRAFSVAIATGLLLILALLLILRRTFKQYFSNIQSIVNITYSVAEGNLQERIDMDNVQGELAVLAESLNFMIESLDLYIKENYELEIKQRDAHMSALQAQINPHFLYNTLEYIRMYALSKNQLELSEVVYAFSALLRNNTTLEKTATLLNELSFCEKYVYLYQMRYPDRVAYNFKLAKELENIEVPKFSLQPLIENYFVHGIDYERNDNAISVKVFISSEDLIIQVFDNGRGMTKARLAEVRALLQTSEKTESKSIGIRNVYERMDTYFNGNFKMAISAKENKGTIITMRIIGGKSLVQSPIG